MDNSLDDLGSFGSVVSSEDKKYQGIASPSSPTRAPASPLYNPLGLTIGQISPGVRSFSSDRSSYGRSESNLLNAVHMHVQENAKIPNYNKNVDRSNSTKIPNKYSQNNFIHADNISHSYQQDADNSALFHNAADFSMAELFLSKESSHRKSLAQNYENLGARTSEIVGAISDDAQIEIDALTAAIDPTPIDPTPWSEIENKIHKEEDMARRKRASQYHSQHHHAYNSVAMSASEAPYSQHPHQSSYYPYGRHYQLPIPEKIPSPLQQAREVAEVDHNEISGTDDGMAQAVATAAAIVATTSGSTGKLNERRFPSSNSAPHPTTPASNGSESKMRKHHASLENSPPPTPSGEMTRQSETGAQSNSQPSSSNRANPESSTTSETSSLRPQHFQRHRANFATPPHAAAHSTSCASVIAAANQKSQYGFGGTHTVPSVPGHPPSQGPRPQVINAHSVGANLSKMNGTTAVQNKAGVATPFSYRANGYTKPSMQGSSLPSTMPTFHDNNNNNAGAAYERKKQRAKDARVKLNESIERLHIAMSLAGSQSKERISQLENSIAKSECRQRTIQVSQECPRLAEQAKKWDRPSFVGTAASLIQSLNGQCEALMLELMTFHQIPSPDSANCNGTGGIVGSSNINRETSAVNGGSAVEGAGKSAAVATSNEMSTSADDNRIDVQQVHPTGQPLSPISAEHKRQEHPVILTSSNKRPRTLSQSSREEDAVDDEEVIYGYVAQFLDPVSLCHCPLVCKSWRDRMAFVDEDVWLALAVKRFGYYNVRQWAEKFEDGEGLEKRMSNKVLYREMNAANVMPHFSQEGVSLLGDAKIPGRVSGWVFIVERSNGETLRSVKREPGTETAGRGTYQSRPVVELRIVVQNIGMARKPAILKQQLIAVDVSTRRSGGELQEITWDDRFRKVVKTLDGTIRKPRVETSTLHTEFCRLDLFETAVFEVHINARGCSTTSKFQQRSNFTKLLVSLDGTTVPMVIPFIRDHGIH